MDIALRTAGLWRQRYGVTGAATYRNCDSMDGTQTKRHWRDEMYRPREEHREAPEVHVSGACVDFGANPWRVLACRRAMTRRLFPGLLELSCGGQLAAGETFEDGVRRHFATELGLDVEVVPAEGHVLYVISERGQLVIPGLRYLCEWKGGVPRSANYDGFEWLTADEIEERSATDFVGDSRGEVLQLLGPTSMVHVPEPTEETMAGDNPLERRLNAYLTRRFITKQRVPADECLSEAREIIEMVMAAQRPIWLGPYG